MANNDLPFGEPDRQLADEISSYWTNFAKTSNPNGDGLPAWPPYDASSHFTVMHLDVPPRAEPDTLRARYQFLDTHQPVPAPPKDSKVLDLIKEITLF